MIGMVGAILAVALSLTTHAANDAVRVLMSTSKGDIEIDLYTDKAPITAGNFLRLVDGGHLNGRSFYRTVTYENDKGAPTIEVIQGGMGAAKSPFSPITHESTGQTGISHSDGVISMARGGIGTASADFFISIGLQPGLDDGGARNPDKRGFAAFGKVVRGMDVVKKIHQAPANGPSDSDYTKGQMLTDPVEIISVRRLR